MSGKIHRRPHPSASPRDIAKEELRTLLSTVKAGGDPHLNRHRLSQPSHFGQVDRSLGVTSPHQHTPFAISQKEIHDQDGSDPTAPWRGPATRPWKPRQPQMSIHKFACWARPRNAAPASARCHRQSVHRK